MDGIKYGFDIIVLGNISNVKRAFCPNYKSATADNVKTQVEAEILHEVNQGCSVISSTKPLIVSAIGAIQKTDSEKLD